MPAALPCGVEGDATKHWSRRHLLHGALSAAVVAATNQVVAAGDDNQLRKHVRIAEMIAYRSFKPVDAFAFTSVRDNRVISVPNDVAGKTVLVNMWATWCPPCIKEMASLQEIYATFRDEPFLVLAVNILDWASRKEIKAWLDSRALTFPVVKGDYEKLDIMPRKQIPQTFLIDRTGRLIANRQGDFNWAHDGVRALVRYMVSDTP